MNVGLAKKKVAGFSNRAGLPKKNILDDGSEFGMCLIKAGATFQKDSTGILLERDPSSYKQQLTKLLKIHLDYPAILNEAVQFMSHHFENDKIVKAFMAPVLLKDDKENTVTNCGFVGLNDSFLRIMLNIDVLQHKLIFMLLNKIVELSRSKRQDSESLCVSIIKQFCWLDEISEPEELVEKLFETAAACESEIQKGIISSLPEIVNDRQHSKVARSLIDLMTSEPQLLLVIIDALDNLSLPDECLQEMKHKVTDLLGSAEVEELPVVLKFLFQHVSADDSIEVVQKIRKNVKLLCDLSARPASTPIKKALRTREVNRGAFGLVIEALKLIPFHKPVSGAWLRAVEELNDTDDVQALDLFVLLILHSTEESRSRVENVFRNKVMLNVITSANMNEVFSIRPEIMEDFFKSIMQLAEHFFRSSYRTVVAFACDLYKLSFAKLSSYCQQEIMGNLVSHVGSGHSEEIDFTLDILVEMSERHLNNMVPYAMFVNGILDFLDNLDLLQVKKVYTVLGRLAFCSPHGKDLQDGLHIIITKQLSSHVLRYQQIGVVGALVTIMNMSLGSVENETLNCTNGSPPGAVENTQQVKDMIELVEANVQKLPQLSALFFDELAAIIRRKCLNKDVVNWITGKVEEDFQQNFVTDIIDGKLTNEGSSLPREMEWIVHFSLEQLVPGEEEFVIDVASLVAKEMSSAPGRSSLWCMSSSFRLLHTCQSSIKDGSLEDIDALLVCGIKLPKNFPMTSNQLESGGKRETVTRLHSAFAVVNWFREVLNAFSNEENEKLRGNVVTRLHDIVALHSLIEKMLLDCPDYAAPMSIYSSDPDGKRPCLVLLPKTVKAPRRSKPNKHGRGKKRARTDADVTKEIIDDEETSCIDITIASTACFNKTMATNLAKRTSRDSTTKSKACLNYSLLATCFRELDMDVFKILSFTKLNGMSDDDIVESPEIKFKLEPSALLFLLEDLYMKLNQILPKNSETRTFLKAKNELKNMGFNNLNAIGSHEVANRVCSIIPHLCRYLEYMSAYFQDSSDKQDTTLDDMCLDLDNHKCMSRCLAILLQVLVSFFSWCNLRSDKKLLRTSIVHISDRMPIAMIKTTLLQEKFKQAFNYLEKFGKIIHDISCSVHLCKLLSCLSILSSCEELKSKTAEVSLNFLKRKWREEEKKADYNMAVTLLINTCFKHSSDVQGIIKVFISSAIPEFLRSEEISESFPTLNKDSLPVYYKLILFHLVEYAKTIAAGTIHTSEDENVEKMLDWSASVKIFRVLIDLIKAFDSRNNLTSALKYGRKFVDLFMRQCIPTLDLLLVTHKDDVQNLFKTLQLSTRYLHHLCSHSKIKKDISLTNLVPQLKCTLEGLIRRVKDMLNRNKCLAAFWLGNLKNRDLKGEEILSQQTLPSSSDDEKSKKDSGDETEDEPMLVGNGED